MLKKEKISAPQKVFVLYSSHASKKDDFKTDQKGHAHSDCWQIEFIVDGEVEMKTKSKSYKLSSGDAIVIPSGIWHRFIFSENSKDNWSLKFSMEGFKRQREVKLVEDSLAEAFIKRNILEFLPKIRDKELASMAEYLLGDLVDMKYCQNEFELEAGILKKIRDTIFDSYGLNIKVNDIARKLGYTKEHLNKIFKKQTGVSLKIYIDMERYRQAQKHLAYSDKNISEISSMMGFPDVFAFSRFFKRMNGDSPRCYKNYIKGQNDF
jgi:AraC family transcriptional activator of pobA